MIPHHLAFALVFIGGLFVPDCSLAQRWPSRLNPGARVQVTVPGASQAALKSRASSLIGIVDHLSTDTLYLRTVDSLSPVAIPVRLIQGLALSRGITTRGRSALRRGALYGALGTAYFALINETNQDHRLSTKTAAVAGGITGAIVGAIYGVLRPSERWERLSLQPAASAQGSLGAMIVLRW